MTTEHTTTTTTDATAGERAVSNPFGSVFEVWNQQLDHVDSMYEELGRRQAQAAEQVNRALAELTKLAQDSVTFTTQLSQEWIRAARGTTRWASELMGAWIR